MKKILFSLLFLLLIWHCNAQVTTPAIKANFGVEADLAANFYTSGNTAAVDDWFNISTVGSGKGVIDTTGAAAIIANYQLSPATRKQAFSRLMAFAPYSIVNNRLLLDAVYHRDFHGSDSTVFGAGSNKNGMSPASWAGPGPASIPDKNDILDAMVHVRRAGPNVTDSLWMYAALSLENTTGNRFYDFELYQTDITFNLLTRTFSGYGPSAGHTQWVFDAAGNIVTPGDIIFTAEFSSSSLTLLEARIWVDRTTVTAHPNPVAFSWGGAIDGSGSQFGYASIKPKTAGAFYTGLQNSESAVWAGPFRLVRDNDAVVTNYIVGQFMEMSINLSKLGIEPANFANSPCGSPFRRVLIKTRSSTSFTSELKDFVAPFSFFNYDPVDAYGQVTFFCGPAYITPLYVHNPNPNSIYTWSTSNGNIVGTHVGDTIYVNAPGTYYVNQQMHSQCPRSFIDSVVITQDIHCIILDMGIKNLQATKQGSQNILHWELTNNQLISRYQVEYSTDNIRFISLSNLPTNHEAGNISYQFSHDASFNASPVIYYRVKAIGINGSVKFSNVATLRNGNSGRVDAMIYPNPSKGALYLSCNNQINENTTVQVINMYGSIVRRFELDLKTGENIYTLPNIAMLPQGSYIVLIPTNQGIIRQKIILSH